LRAGEQQLMADKPENFTLAERMKNGARELDWIFPELWEARTAGMIAGDSGLGKTHFVMQILHAIAQGEPIPNTPFVCTKPRPVVYISQEDEAQFIRDEFFTQNPTLKKNKAACERIRIVSTYRQGPTLKLDNSDHFRLMESYLTAGCVFALDSLITFAEGDISSPSYASRQMEQIRGLMKSCEGTALVINHRPKQSNTGHQSGHLGAQHIRDAVRFFLILQKDGDDRRLEFDKVNRGSKPADIALTMNNERRVFEPEKDPWIECFNPGEQLTTEEVMKRMDLDLDDERRKKRTANALRKRAGQGKPLKQITKARRSQPALWELKQAA
jgi:RecA-family ATPase